MYRKIPKADLRLSYPIIVEAGIIVSLLLLIISTKVHLPEQKTTQTSYVESEETALILPPSISESRQVKPPPIPTVPIDIPNDSPIEPPPIELEEFNTTDRLMIPPLPDEIFVDTNYELFKDIEQLPVMVGGEDAFRNSISYPELARRAGIQGIVEVEFLVDEYGRVHSPVIVRGIGGGCDKAVLKAIKLQRYKPGKKAGKIASFKVKETVQFILLDA